MNSREQYIDQWEEMTGKAIRLIGRARAWQAGHMNGVGTNNVTHLSTDDWDELTKIVKTLNRNVER